MFLLRKCILEKMNTNDPVKEFREEREEQRKEAIAQLNEFKQNKITLEKPVFFVPGWTDETCQCWTGNEKNKDSIKTWFEGMCFNSDLAYFINFEEESDECESFLDFGLFLKQKIERRIGDKQEFDIVGHSMGGLDTRAAVIQENPLLNINKCITVATPHRGGTLLERF